MMKHMKNSSAPGIDGFTVAWVKEFWVELSDSCVQAFNACFDNNNKTHKAARNFNNEDIKKRRERPTGCRKLQTNLSFLQDGQWCNHKKTPNSD